MRASILLFAIPAAAFGQAGVWYQRDFPQQEFRSRWEKVFDKIGGGAVAVVQGAPQTNGFIMPRQSNEFYYLCGIETPHAYLLLDGRNRSATLYLPPRNQRLESAEGKVLSADDAEEVKGLTGVKSVLSTDVIRGEWFGKLPGGTPKSIYTPFSPAEGNSQSRGELVSANAGIAADYWDGRLPREAHFVELLRSRYPRARVLDLPPILDDLRSIKSAREIALIRRASQIAGLGIMEAIRSTRAGLFEYHLDAAAHALGKLFKYVGENNVLWGTDSIWYGSPQDQIQAFRTFQLSDTLMAKHGYPKLTPALRAKVFGRNALKVYKVSDEVLKKHLPRDRVALERTEYRERADPTFLTHGPKTRREFLTLKSRTGGTAV